MSSTMSKLLDAMGLERVALAGASLGGYMAAAFAVAHPGRVSRLALVCPAGIYSPEFPMANLRDAKLEEIPDLFIVDKTVIESFWPDRWNECVAREGQSAGKAFGPSSTFGPKLLRRLGRVTMPTLVIWGREDRVLPSGTAALWGNAIPHATIRIVDGRVTCCSTNPPRPAAR